MAASAYRITVYSCLAEVEATWRAYEGISDHYVFQKFDLSRIWYETVGVVAGIRPCLAAVDCPPGNMLLFLPFGITTNSRGLDVLTWLGDELVDYHAPLVARDFAERLSATDFAGLWDEIQDALPPFDVVHFRNQPEFVMGHRNPFAALEPRRNFSNANAARLVGDWESFYRARTSTKIRSQDRRHERRLSERGTLRYTVLDDKADPAQVDCVLAALYSQKSRRYDETGARNLFAVPENRDFYDRWPRDPTVARWRFLATFTIDDEIIAAEMGFVDRGRMYLTMTSFTGSELRKYSPGRLIQMKSIRWGFENGLQVLDLTIGDEAYKFNWCDQKLPLYEHLTGRTAKGRLYLMVRRLKKTCRTILGTGQARAPAPKSA